MNPKCKGSVHDESSHQLVPSRAIFLTLFRFFAKMSPNLSSISVFHEVFQSQKALNGTFFSVSFFQPSMEESCKIQRMHSTERKRALANCLNWEDIATPVSA